MEPQIRYVKSADGTRIATCSLGRGHPLVFVTNFFVTIELLWEIPQAIQNIERLSETRRVVLADARGAGLSGQHVDDFSSEAAGRDLEAVVESVDSATIDLIGAGPTCEIVAAYATRHADKVRRLVLESPVFHGSQLMVDDRQKLLLPLAAADWEFYLQCASLLNFGWTEVGRRVAEKQAKDAKRGVWARSYDQWTKQDLAPILPLVMCPTLVLDPVPGTRLSAMVAKNAASQVAAAIPDARLVRYSQDHSIMLSGAWDSCLRHIEAFLDEADEAMTGQPTALSGTAIIFFADIVDSTALTERLGDTAFREKARDLDTALRKMIHDNGGTPIDGKLLGDGVLATFTSASQAIAAALACGRAGDEGRLPLHLGLHAGDVIREDNNVFGGAVNVAARISGLSAPGEVLVSATVRDLARTSAGVSFEDRGEHSLKGVSEPVRVWRVI